MATEEMDTHEVFENIFFYFIKILRVLSEDAATQCGEMDNYSTPWEIQRNINDNGLGVLRLSAPLSWEQAEKILDLVAAVRRLPKEAITPVGMPMTSYISSITAMNHPAWEPLRKEAAQLLQLLEPAIRKNKVYFQNS